MLVPFALVPMLAPNIKKEDDELTKTLFITGDGLESGKPERCHCILGLY